MIFLFFIFSIVEFLILFSRIHLPKPPPPIPPSCLKETRKRQAGRQDRQTDRDRQETESHTHIYIYVTGFEEE
ncbi:hypothetical protein F5X96DRAFT_640130 [Biscogniauxia mediterranea]|nr:hypothetical protein F5X96DRAFT_640130 [Biscogniauxia mediterranea]